MLRFVSPVMNFRRTAMCDTDARAGPTIAAGDKVVFFHASANRDEDVFEDPDTLRHHAATPTPTSPSAAAGPTSAWAPTWPAWRSG